MSISFLLGVHCAFAALGACSLVEEKPDVAGTDKECGQLAEHDDESTSLQFHCKQTLDVVLDDVSLLQKNVVITTQNASGAEGKRFPSQVFQCPVATVQAVGSNIGFYKTVAESISKLYSKLTTTQEKQDLAACIVRFEGHDVMDFRFWRTGRATGGSDGCIDFADGDNAGLEECIVKSGLQGLYEKHCASISLADFLVIAAETMMAISSDYWSNFGSSESLEARFMSKFEFGRQTRNTCSKNERLLPDPEEGCFDLKRTFVDHIFLDQSVDKSWKATAAISGVHTLGSCKQHNSGYDGAWTEDPWKFNNAYYKLILSRGWQPELSIGGNPRKNQWGIAEKNQDASPKNMMLNSDMCLLYDNGLDSVLCDSYLLGGSGYNEASKKEKRHRNVFCARIRGRGFFMNARERTCCAWTRPDKMWADPIDNWHAKNPEDMWNPLAALYDKDKANSHCGGEFASPQDAWAKFGNFRDQCCGSIVGGEAGDRLDCDYRGNLEAPAWEWVNRFALDESAWLESFVEAWTWATTNSLRYTQNKVNAALRFASVTRPNCGCCRKHEIVDGDEGYEECELLKREDTYEESFWKNKRPTWPLAPSNSNYSKGRPSVTEKFDKYYALTDKWGSVWGTWW